MTTSRTPSRRITQRRIAELAGVSQATVSLVLNDKADGAARIPEETRERVLKVLARDRLRGRPRRTAPRGGGQQDPRRLHLRAGVPHREPGLLRAAAQRHRAGRRGARLRPAALHERARGERLAPALPRAQPPAPGRRMPPARCRDGPRRARAPRRRRIPVRRGRPSRRRRRSPTSPSTTRAARPTWSAGRGSWGTGASPTSTSTASASRCSTAAPASSASSSAVAGHPPCSTLLAIPSLGDDLERDWAAIRASGATVVVVERSEWAERLHELAEREGVRGARAGSA